jgi:hypothetical protein
MLRFACSLVLGLSLLPVFADNPHDGYVFWLPSGKLVLGDAQSENTFAYQKTPEGVSFVVRPRHTRFGVPAGQIVLVRQGGTVGQSLECRVDGTSIGPLGEVTFLPLRLTEGKEQVNVELRPSLPGNLLVYYTDDADKLGITIEGDLTALPTPGSYRDGLLLLWAGEYAKAKDRLLGGVTKDKTPQAARLLRRLARWADASAQFHRIRSGEGYYKLGMYSMTNGFWDLAVSCFSKATQLTPKDPDAWFMLADAMSYQLSDLDQRLEQIVPYYKAAANLYPREGSNTYRNHIGLFKKFRVKDGDTTQVLTMTDEQMEYARKTWGWCSTILEACSRGALRIVNTFDVYEDEYDNTGHTDPRPFADLHEPGSQDVFIKFSGWGASDCMGHDCGPDRTAAINLGMREWSVMYHEWNHSIDWAMITSELGVGVPVTHSSDWCGFEPIPSMGMGHHSCNRYYMTPGMYRFLRGSDPVTTEHVTDWYVSGPFELMPETSEVNEQFGAQSREKTVAVKPPAPDSLSGRAKTEDGYVDLRATWPEAPKNAYAFAHTYVYSPVRQKVRMWLGADDNVRVWLNDRLVHKGLYWAVCLFQEMKEKDQVATGVFLEKGWNSLLLQVTNTQHGEDWLVPGVRPDCWGFSVRFCDNQNRVLPGLRWQSAKPAGFLMPRYEPLNPRAPKTYRWGEVADDYTMLLPHLTLDDLRAITGYKTMTATNEIFFDLSGEELHPAFRALTLPKADPANIALNNELNWYFSPKEMAAVVRYKRQTGQTRDLLFLRPEAYETFLALLPVKPEAAKRGIKRHADQVIGYFTVPRDESPNGRIVLVVDTYLGDELPIDEEDLLAISALR